jgi:hypothetical protein
METHLGDINPKGKTMAGCEKVNGILLDKKGGELN